MKKMLALLMALVMVMLCTVSVAAGETAGKIAVGDIVTFGRYPQTAEGTDETPIEWIVLDIRDGKALLLSRFGLDAKCYNKEYGDYNWKSCSLRAWLNSEFMEKAFSAEEQERILTANVPNCVTQTEYTGWNDSAEKSTQDKVFLLSSAEAGHFFGVTMDEIDNYSSRVSPTPYAVSRGARLNENDKTTDGMPSGGWWLRTHVYFQKIGDTVNSAGWIKGDSVQKTNLIRPALWVDLSKME